MINIFQDASITRSNLPSVSEACSVFRDLASRKGLSAPRKVDKPLVLYGAGNLGKMAKEFFEMLGIPFLYVVDANPEQHQATSTWNGIAIQKPTDVPQEHRTEYLLVICIATAPYQSIAAPVMAQGWKDVVPFYDITEAYIDRCPLSNGWFSEDFSPDDLAGTEYVLKHWADGISRAQYLQFIAWHHLRQELTFAGAPVTKGDRFFIPEIISSLHEKEVFLDGGAHHGEVSLRFMNEVHHRFAKVYAIEPDKHNVKVLRSNLGGEKNVEIIEDALGKKSGMTTFFHGLDYASQFSSLAEDSVTVRILDEIDIPATFIKLHLEGWELDALQGSWRTLNKYRPLLAVTTYHKRNGLWQLPYLLMKELPDYVFLLRLHAWMGTGCVMYAIPRERYLH